MIRRAEPADLGRIEALLASAALPVAGVAEHLGAFFVADEEGRITAAAGLEAYGDVALLRSVAVAPEAAGAGLGSTLTRLALAEARARGAREVYLLTTTAERFFPRFGFSPVARAALPGALGASHELRGACPASAIAMRARLVLGR